MDESGMRELQQIFPIIRYRDGDAAIPWLLDAFGITEKVVERGDDGALQHVELRCGGDVFILSEFSDSPRDWESVAGEPGCTAIYVAIEDVDAMHARAVAAGARIARPLQDQEYGSREFTARDLEGNSWSFGTYRPASSDQGAA